MAKKVKTVTRVGDDSVILEEIPDEREVLEQEELQVALDRATVPLGEDVFADNAETILFSGLEGRMLLVKVGRPGEIVDSARLKAIEEDLSALIENAGVKCLLYITTSDVDIQVVG